jgi:dTDP-4-amino-4,6-dideoxygalactose transaminase
MAASMPDRVRFLTPQLPGADAIERYFRRSREERWFSNDGPCLRLFVERAEGRLGRGLHMVPTASGTAALLLGLRALAGPPRGGREEVVLPSFTFAATASAVIWNGYKPVFADVEPDSWHLSPRSLEEALASRGDRVAAVVACSTFGTAPPLWLSALWTELCEGAGVPLIIDSAAGFGARDEQGELLGGQGRAEIFSFHATKPFAIGEGGALVTADPGLAEAVRRLANFGFGTDSTVVEEPGLNGKLDEWHAAAALACLDELDTVLAARRERAQAIRAALSGHDFGFQEGADRGTWQFVPALAPWPGWRDAALDAGAAQGIELRRYFDPPLHAMPAFAGWARAGALDVTESLATRVLSLPMANDLSAEAIERIGACVLSVAATGSPR